MFQVNKFSISKIYIVLIFVILVLLACSNIKKSEKSAPDFDGDRAYQDVVYQVSLGPRIPGTLGHAQILEWMEAELKANQWQVEHQSTTINGKEIINLIASRGAGEYILLGAHYDTRIYADQDPATELRKQPVPGANDGGSGVAVLLELARILPVDLQKPIKLVFFDAEDNGGIDDWDWILGSRAYVKEIEQKPAAVIIVDMIGDADLEVYYERNSDSSLMEEIWMEAINLGYGNSFIQEYRHSMLDDHTPFVEAGIPAVDIIDFNYPFWHTTADTPDKVSPQSLKAIGDTLASWLMSIK